MKTFYRTILKELTRITDLKDIKLETPPDDKWGDLAFPCFQLSKQLKKAPKDIAEKLAKDFNIKMPVKEIKVVGSYLNFYVDKTALTKETLKNIQKQKEKYGSQNIGKRKKIVIDFSSPNIAKPFGIGHLRSTVIGNSIYRTLAFLNYKPIGVNHLGDWGTQFGKMIYAYQKWGPPSANDNSEKEKFKRAPISYLYSLYVKFHQEAKINPELEKHGKEWFKKLEEGDQKATKLWEMFRKLSLNEFKRYYEELNINFDSYSGEAFYNKMLEKTVKVFEKKKLTEISENALIVPLRDMPPLMLKKSDKATTYATRDLAAAMFRIKEYKPEKLLYVVGTPQQLHFQQLFTTLNMAGYKKEMFEHINFGHLNFKDGKMSTRDGNIIFLKEVLDKSIQLALQTIKNKNPDLKNKEKVAKVIGIGAVIFADLCNDRIKDVIFDWDKILNYEGETAPYIQYAYARICSILRKSENKPVRKILGKGEHYNLLSGEQEQKIIKLLANFPETVKETAAAYKPSILARYSLDLAQAFNEFYHACPILKAQPEQMHIRLELIESVKQVLKTSMYLLGIDVVEEM